MGHVSVHPCFCLSPVDKLCCSLGTVKELKLLHGAHKTVVWPEGTAKNIQMLSKLPPRA